MDGCIPVDDDEQEPRTSDFIGNLISAAQGAIHALYCAPEVGKKYDANHSALHIAAALRLQDALKDSQRGQTEKRLDSIREHLKAHSFAMSHAADPFEDWEREYTPTPGLYLTERVSLDLGNPGEFWFTLFFHPETPDDVTEFIREEENLLDLRGLPDLSWFSFSRRCRVEYEEQDRGGRWRGIKPDGKSTRLLYGSRVEAYRAAIEGAE